MPDFGDAPFKPGDRVVIYTGTPLVDGGVIGTIKRLDSRWVVAELANRPDMWLPADNITGMSYPGPLD